MVRRDAMLWGSRSPSMETRMTPFGLTRREAVSLVFAATVAGCERSATTSPAASVAGRYTSTTFVYTAGGIPNDIVALGGGLTLTLAASGQTVAGSFNAAIPSPTNIDMAGTYTVSGDTVRFQQAASTFVAAVPWLHAGNQLTYSGLYFGGPNSISVVMTRN